VADKKVNATKIQAALKGHKGIVTNVDEFHDRFYLIHGIYGHALKTLTMATSHTFG
jgi:cyanate lyase